MLSCKKCRRFQLHFRNNITDSALKYFPLYLISYTKHNSQIQSMGLLFTPQGHSSMGKEPIILVA